MRYLIEYGTHINIEYRKLKHYYLNVCLSENENLTA